MPEGSLLWIAIAAVVSALALVTQAVAVFGAYRAVRKLQTDIAPLVPEVRLTLTQAREALVSSTEKIEALSVKAHAALDATNRQLAAFDTARQDVTQRVQVQMERMELVLDDSLCRVQDVVATLHRGVLKPVREVTGIAAGIKAAFQAFARSSRPSVAQATHDEEMFI
jgi:hypothetical protein